MAKTEALHEPTDAPPFDPLSVELLLGIDRDEPAAKDLYRIGELAEEFGISLRTLRFYEQRRLLRPTRRGPLRLYSRADRRRLRIVLLAKALGFSLVEAKQLLDVYAGPKAGLAQSEQLLRRFEEQRLLLVDEYRDTERSIEAMDVAMTVLKDATKAS